MRERKSEGRKEGRKKGRKGEGGRKEKKEGKREVHIKKNYQSSGLTSELICKSVGELKAKI